MQLYGKLIGINRQKDYCTLSILHNDLVTSIRVSNDSDTFYKDSIYLFEVVPVLNKVNVYYSQKFMLASKASLDIRDKVLREYFLSSKYDLNYLISKINYYIDSINSLNIKTITRNIVERFKDDFYTFKAGARMHHAYIGGLATHTINMLEVSNTFINIYDNINKDFVYSGIILHDLAKVLEYNDIQDTTFTYDGYLLGHSISIILEIEKEALLLNISDSLEVKHLMHIILSHHGKLEYGATKVPTTIEALLVSNLDSIDSKLDTVNIELQDKKSGEFTDQLPVINRQKILKI